MSSNNRKGIEEVDSNGVRYLFKSDFGFLALLREMTNESLFITSEKISENDPVAVMNVLSCSLIGKSGDNVDEFSLEQKQNVIKEFITLHGLQECNILASTMLTYAMIGDIKKKQISNHQTTANMIDGLLISPSQIFRNHVLLWVYVSTISGISTCLIIKLLSQHI